VLLLVALMDRCNSALLLLVIYTTHAYVIAYSVATWALNDHRIW